MNFENSLFVMPFTVGIIFMIAAFIMLKFPPKDINMLYGYRTKRSMKSKKHWNFSQQYSSKLMIFCGFGLVLFSILGLLFSVTEGQGVLFSIIALIAAVLILVYKTEKALKNKFMNE